MAFWKLALVYFAAVAAVCATSISDSSSVDFDIAEDSEAESTSIHTTDVSYVAILRGYYCIGALVAPKLVLMSHCPKKLSIDFVPAPTFDLNPFWFPLMMLPLVPDGPTLMAKPIYLTIGSGFNGSSEGSELSATQSHNVSDNKIDDDLYLIKLDTPSTKAPVALLSSNGSAPEYGSTASVLGWSVNNTAKGSLQQRNVTILAPAQCNVRIENASYSLCVQSTTQSDTCLVPGSLLVVNQNGTDVLVGFMNKGGCGRIGEPTLFNRVRTSDLTVAVQQHFKS